MRIANARMYAVTPEVEAAWAALIARVAADAGLRFAYEAYAAPRPLDALWARDDLGCVFMCGYPIALEMAEIVPIAAPVPDAAWAGGRAVYRSDLIVRADAPYATLADTFGGRTGWTVRHSHSGFNAWRHHLLGHRHADRAPLYAQVVPDLVTARGVLDAVLAGRIDVGPLDAYWHMLIAAARPDLIAGIRVLASTDTAPMPAFVASRTMPEAEVAALRQAFAAAAERPWFAALAGPLRLTGFAAVAQADFAATLRWDADARAAGYAAPG